MSPADALRAIVEEVAGVGQSFSADSCLPAHLIHDAREALDAAESAPVTDSADQAYSQLMLARLQKADQMLVALRSEVESLRAAESVLTSRICALMETNLELDRKLESARSAQSASHAGSAIPIFPTAYARLECDDHEGRLIVGRMECDA